MSDSPPTLAVYAAAVGELVLFLRDEGTILTSMDQHLIASWWEAGYPLPTVLRSVREMGERLKRRKRPPRGLPLSSMRKVVEREGSRARDRASAAVVNTASVEYEATTLLGFALSELALDRRDDPPGRRRLLDDAASQLRAAADDDASAAFVALLAASRCYYDALLGLLPKTAQDALHAEVMSEIGPAMGRMAPDARGDAIREQLRRRVRDRDPVLDPLRLEEGSRT